MLPLFSGFRFSQLVMSTYLVEESYGCDSLNFLRRDYAGTIAPSFHFEPAKQEVTWRYFGVLSPGVKGHPSPDLPLRVTLLRSNTI